MRWWAHWRSFGYGLLAVRVAAALSKCCALPGMSPFSSPRIITCNVYINVSTGGHGIADGDIYEDSDDALYEGLVHLWARDTSTDTVLLGSDVCECQMCASLTHDNPSPWYVQGAPTWDIIRCFFYAGTSCIWSAIHQIDGNMVKPYPLGVSRRRAAIELSFPATQPLTAVLTATSVGVESEWTAAPIPPDPIRYQPKMQYPYFPTFVPPEVVYLSSPGSEIAGVWSNNYASSTAPKPVAAEPVTAATVIAGNWPLTFAVVSMIAGNWPLTSAMVSMIPIPLNPFSQQEFLHLTSLSKTDDPGIRRTPPLIRRPAKGFILPVAHPEVDPPTRTAAPTPVWTNPLSGRATAAPLALTENVRPSPVENNTPSGHDEEEHFNLYWWATNVLSPAFVEVFAGSVLICVAYIFGRWHCRADRYRAVDQGTGAGASGAHNGMEQPIPANHDDPPLNEAPI